MGFWVLGMVFKFVSPKNIQKTIGFLRILGRIEVSSLKIRNEIWRQPLQTEAVVQSFSIEQLLYKLRRIHRKH